ncbi:MAG: preprotein translocase subunit SecG [Candidatus Marinimicrobia bacterium]|jgi:preprotein translocase subunit SecG|nr:preprotein translocase subunit SecG [Candidatus Neomarinimicrobiota bacterium]MBT4155428.1 preprotein translocase subunit SecG [Candidatus Neomarinimicrobiota bacterium]MBT4554520.1 preprotein translocase subunit SecG [Candidatus Neomarinimicrobiota bacterium]MBT4753024.1 preprotein translocase subunit SecG [Candidatus Neomarinimicrobiota bacterium]MBT5114927.1 preprotein translocase subunit SecG [Candidatus Neomarinimicrobiota bacterium]|tara:strand:- start:2481 stop:2828 length:348 start_codon:yes stop_codon:yes gene_type:complete
MTGILIVIHAIVSLMLISVILMQASQGGGLSGTFGGNSASSVLGGQNAGNVLSRITTWLATIFLSLAVVISIMSGPSENSTSSIVKQAAEDRPITPVTEQIPIGTEGTLDLSGDE